MSFVAIREEKNPVEMHNKVYEASKNNELTPEVCMEILSHTNVPVIMKEMLEKIEKLPIEEQGQYIGVILSMFDKRLTSNKVRDKALEMAKNLEFESELNDVIERTGDFAYSARNGVKDEIYVIDKAGDYIDVNFCSCKGVIVNGKIEEEIIFGSYFDINSRNHTLSGVLDLRGAKNVDLSRCDLSKVIKIIFEEGASVFLGEAKNLPSNLDVSMCDKVELNECNLEGISLKFKDGAKVKLEEATNLPSNLDVSMCDVVNLIDCNLEKINLKFKEGAKVDLYNATNLPKDLDVSMCDKVDLSKCNLEGISLKFKDGAKVKLEEATNLPSNLDVSMCECVTMNDADISKVKELKFKNEEQMMKSQVKIPEGWGGKVIYTDDEKQMPVISRENDGR